MCLDNRLATSLFLTFILGRGMFDFLDFSVAYFNLSEVKCMLVPLSQAALLAQWRDECDDSSNRIPKQINIGREMNVSFGNKGIATSCQRFFFVFFSAL